MDGIDATLWIRCGAGMATVGLYALMKTAPVNRNAVRLISWGVYCLGGVMIAGTVLESTGSFWSLLLFCGLGATALFCATMATVHQPRVEHIDIADQPSGRIPLSGDLRWFLGTVATVAALLLWHGNYWCGGLLLLGVVCLATTGLWGSRHPVVRGIDGSNDLPHGFREPALACLMWGLLICGLMTALQHRQLVSGGISTESARLNNAIATGCAMLSLGVLQIASRKRLRNRALGMGGVLLGTLLVCSAGEDPAQSNLLCLVVMTCSIVNIVFIVRATRKRPSDMAASPLPEWGDA